MKQAGFTLLELLVGLVVLGFILAGLSQGVRYGYRATEAQARVRNGSGDLDAIDRTLRGLIEQADPGDDHSGPTLRGTASMVVFTSDLPAAASGTTRHADVAILVDPAHRLVLRWTPHLHATAFVAPAPPVTTELIRNVQVLQASYWADGWQSNWDKEGLPSLVRLRVLFPPGDSRHWPDIVIALRRQRSSG